MSLRIDSPRGGITASAVLAAALTLAGCGIDSDDDVACTTESRVAITMTSVDARTGAPVPIASVTMVRTAGPTDTRYVETRVDAGSETPTGPAGGVFLPLQITRDGEAVLWDVVGTFDVSLQAAGYRDFTRRGIEVRWTDGRCYKVEQMVTLRAEMVRLAP